MFRYSPAKENGAIIYTLKYLFDNLSYEWYDWRLINQGRYAIVIGKNGNPNISIILKREWFMRFGYMNFKDKHGNIETGIGDSINEDDFNHMLVLKVKEIYIVHADAIYSISVDQFKDNSHLWKNKEGKWSKSISLRHYKRVNG